jgi:hypothetical protein
MSARITTLSTRAHRVPMPEAVRREFLAHVEAELGLTFPEDEPFYVGSIGTTPFKATPNEDDEADKFWYYCHDAPAWRVHYGYYPIDGGPHGKHRWDSGAVSTLSAAERKELRTQNQRVTELERREAERLAKQSRDRAFAEYEYAATPATLAHGYLARKRFEQVPPGVKQIMRGAYKKGELEAVSKKPVRSAPEPTLVVPLRKLGSPEMTSCEYIPETPKARKETPWKVPRDGDCYLFGEYPAGPRPGNAPPIFFAEGLASAWVPFRLTGYMSVRCGSADDIGKVLRDARHVYGDAALFIVLLEKGNGNETAQRAADTYGAAVAEMPFAEDEEGTDIWDYWNHHGDQATLAALAEAKPPAAPAAEAGEDVYGAWVESINKRFAVVQRWGDDVAIVGFDEDGEPYLADERALRLHLANRRARPGDKQPHLIWQRALNRREYRRAAFDPEWRTLDRDRDLNLFRGFAIQPAEGDWSLYRNLVHDVISAGDRQLAEYLLNYLAHVVQRPGTPTKVALVLYGAQGVGKNTFTDPLLRIFGRHAEELSERDMLVGQFTGHLEDKVLVLCDEMTWAGDNTFQERLKSMITAQRVMVHYKGRTPFSRPNTRNFLLTTNHDHAIRLEPGDRRFCVVHVPDIFVHLHGDEKASVRDAHFAPLRAQMEHNGGDAALLHHLQHRDLSSFDVRAYPRTAAHAVQAELSMSSVDRWLVRALREGTYAPFKGRLDMRMDGSGPDATVWAKNSEAAKDTIYADYREYCKDTNLRYIEHDAQFWERMRARLGTLPQRQRTQGTRRARVVVLPDIDVARERVAGALGLAPFEKDLEPAGEPTAGSREP